MPAAEQRVFSVSQLTALIKDCMESTFPDIWIAGEIADYSQSSAGHIYMTLKDQQAQIRCVVWRGVATRLKFAMKDGMQIVAQGEMNVYPPRGTYQLSLRAIEPRGEGAQILALRQLHAKLSAEGLFDPGRKRSLPPFPKQVVLITSPTGAAVRDFLEVVRRRWQGIHVLIAPARVQGEGAAQEIVRAIQSAGRLQPAPQVLVVARGGGSTDDLACFNDERVVRAIHASPIPVVSAVGHEIDVTLSDLVADVRALTPTEAAERIVPSSEEVLERLGQKQRRLLNGLRRRVREYQLRVQAVANHRLFRRPFSLTDELAMRLDELHARAHRATRQRVASAREQWKSVAGRIESLSPLATLQRGYSVTLLADQKTVIRNAQTVAVGDRIVTRLAEGSLTSRVESIERGQEGT
ncbi:MAG: Exodeoxyribonuclease 7 large subunit [Planctomycetota bacterium]